MGLAIFGFKKRPQVDSQNTGRDVYERPYGVGTVSVQGLGGANNFRSLSPFNISGFNPAFVATASPTGQGSPNSVNMNPELQPLLDQHKTSPFNPAQF